MKRFLDIVLSAVAVCLFSPLLLVVALIIRINMGGPVLFRQMRPGLGGRSFQMVKFRSMRDAVQANGEPRPDAERLTRLGQKLRALSIDELPELWNVLRGDMSLVGPRPLLMEYLPLYSARQMRRHEVRPGLTGWAQINGRNALSWEDKFELDVWYVENRSIGLDLRIMWMTVAYVLKREGISAAGEATMQRFAGTRGDEHEVKK